MSLNGKWKWPIAYFFKHCMTPLILKELIESALILIAGTGLYVRAITCDGESVNCVALKELGCNIFANDITELKNSFLHPSLNYKVCVFLDACHMLKLARNTFAEYKVFSDSGSKIEWAYITKLHNIQTQLTLK